MMAVDRRGKPYYYLSCADVDDNVGSDNAAVSQGTREDVAKFLLSILCKTNGRNNLGNINTKNFCPLTQQGINTVDALKQFCQSFPQCFTICPSPSNEDLCNVEVEVTTELKLCPMHLRKMGSCPEDGECGYLHMCKFFMLSGKCECGTQSEVRRLFAHQLTSDHNKVVLKHRLMDHLTLKNVRTLVKRRHARTVQLRPFICRFYNNQGGCSKGPRCGALHICRRFVLNECKFGADCMRSHDLMEPSVKSILAMYDISPEDLPSFMQDSQQELSAGPTSQPQSLTMGQSGTKCSPGNTTFLSGGEQDELRGGHWCHPSEKDSHKVSSCTTKGLDGGNGSEDSTVPIVPQTVFSRRRGHKAESASGQQSGEGGQRQSVQPAPPCLNPFSYITVGDQHQEASTGLNLAATTAKEEKGPQSGDEGTAKSGGPDPLPVTEVSVPPCTIVDSAKTKDANVAFRKAEDVLFGQTPNSSFIPLKPADISKTLTMNLTPGRPVASVAPQLKIKPELGISRKVDISKPPEGLLVDGKKREVTQEWEETTRSDVTQTYTAVSSIEKLSLSLPASSPSQAESLQSIIAGLISNVKKLHSQNLGPEQHLVSYLAELAHPDKLKEEMKAAEEKSEEKKVVVGDQRPGETSRSDGEISDSDHEMEAGVSTTKPLQEKILFDYNHRPTVDLIGEMLNTEDSSPFKETPDDDSSLHLPDREKAYASPGLERTKSSNCHGRTGSLRRQHRGGKRDLQYELVDSPEADRHLEEVSSANSAISDIMSSEEDQAEDSEKKTELSLKDSENTEKGAKEGPIDIKSSESAISEEQLEIVGSQGEGSVGPSAQAQESEGITIQANKLPKTVPSENTTPDQKMKISRKSPDRVKESSARSAAQSSCAAGPRKSSPAKKSLDPRSSPDKKSSSPGNKGSSEKPSECDKKPSDPRRSSDARKSPRSSSYQRNKGSSPGNNRSSLENKRISTKYKKSSSEKSGSSGSRRPPPGSRRSSPGTKRSSDLGRVSRVNRSSDRRTSSANRSSVGRSRYDDKRLTPSPSRKRPSFHQRSPHSPRRCLSSPRGHSPDLWRSSSDRRKTSRSPQKLSPHYRRSPPRTKEEGYPARRHSPFSDRYRGRQDKGDRELQGASPHPHCRTVMRGEKDWNEREKKRMSEDTEYHKLRNSSEERRERDDYRFRREKEKMAKEMREHRSRSRSYERWACSVERSPRAHNVEGNSHIISKKHSLYEHRRRLGSMERWLPSPSRDRKRALSSERWKATAPSCNPYKRRRRSLSRTSDCFSSRRHGSLFGSREGSLDGRQILHRSDRHEDVPVDEQWLDCERGRGRFPPSESSLNDSGHRGRDEFFHGEHSLDADSREKSFAQREFHSHPEETFWNRDGVNDDRFPANIHDLKKGSIRSRLGPSPIPSKDHLVEGMPDERFRERELQVIRDGHISPFVERQYLSGEMHDIHMEESQLHEVLGGPFPGERHIDSRQEVAGTDNRKTNRGDPPMVFPKSYKFRNYEDWKQVFVDQPGSIGDRWDSSVTKTEAMLKYSCQPEDDDRPLNAPYGEEGKEDWRQADLHFRSSPHHLHLSHSSPGGFRHHRDWPRSRHRSRRQPQDADFEADFHMEDSDAPQRFRKHERRSLTSSAPEREGLTLRDQIDDLLDKARHSSSRGPSPCQDSDKHFPKSDISPPEGIVELDDRQHVSLRYEDHSPNQHHFRHRPHRHFHSQEKRADEIHPRPSSKRQRESSDRDNILETNKIRVSGRSRDSEPPHTEPRDRHHPNYHDHFPQNRDWENRLTRSESPLSHRQGQPEQFRRGSRNYMRNESGLKIKMMFSSDGHDVARGHMEDEGSASYQDLDKPCPEDDDHTLLLDPQAEEDNNGRDYGDTIYGEDDAMEDFDMDGADQGFTSHLEDVGDMIQAQKARVMRLDLRNLLKSRRTSQHFSQAENEPIQVRVQCRENRKQLTRKKYPNDGGREVIVTGRH